MAVSWWILRRRDFLATTDYRLSRAIGEQFNNLTLLQQQLIGRKVPAGAKLDILPDCNRRAAKAHALASRALTRPERSRHERSDLVRSPLGRLAVR
jgi:hypothetical protein